MRRAVEGMRARLPLNALPPMSTVDKLVAEPQLGWTPVHWLSLSFSMLSIDGTVKLQAGPMRLVLRSMLERLVLENVRVAMFPVMALPLNEIPCNDVEVHVRGSCPVMLEDAAYKYARAAICPHVVGIELPIMLLEMEMVRRLPIGVLPEPHDGSGPMRLHDEQLNDVKLASCHDGIVLLMGLLLRSSVTR